MITQTITALLLSTGIDLGLISPESTPPPAAIAADTGETDTGMAEASDDTGDADTGSGDASVEDSGSDEVNDENSGSDQDSDTVDTGSDNTNEKFSASELAGEKGGCSTAPHAPTHLIWVVLGVLGWRRRTR